MLDSINCAIINLIVADDPKNDNVKYGATTPNTGLWLKEERCNIS